MPIKKEHVYFQVFSPKIHNIWRAGIFRMATFSDHLLQTASEYSMFLPFTKNKSQNINIIGDEICIKSKSKLLKLYTALQIIFISQIVRVEM